MPRGAKRIHENKPCGEWPCPSRAAAAAACLCQPARATGSEHLLQPRGAGSAKPHDQRKVSLIASCSNRRVVNKDIIVIVTFHSGCDAADTAEDFRGVCPIRAVILNIWFCLTASLPRWDSLGLVPRGAATVQDNAWHTIGAQRPCRRHNAVPGSQPPRPGRQHTSSRAAAAPSPWSSDSRQLQEMLSCQ